ncbi:MAG: ABC transporter permease [Melioribacteraceae bacterium]|nr:ABC transporter permease [Melioribacteraceae bacterium]
MFELFIAKKYLKTKNKLNFISIISILSTLGITIGVAALVIVISVFNGFGSIAIKMLVDSSPHIKIISVSENLEADKEKIDDIISNDNRVLSYSPYLQGKIVVAKSSTYQILDVKGISPNSLSESWGVSNKLMGGDINFSASSKIPEAAISLTSALKLSARIGDTLTATSLKSIEKMLTNFLVIPNRMQFVVKGIYKSNSKDQSGFLLYTNLNSAKRLLKKNNISGYEIRLKNIDDASIIKSELENILPQDQYSIYTWYDMNKDFYNVLKIERWGAFILLLLIISVATFNILGSLTMSVIQKRRDIGILRSMGVSKNGIQKIFMFEGILIGAIGTISGMIIGLLVCYLQIELKLYPLDPAKYIIDAIPMKLQISDLIIIPIASMFLSFVASLYPARRAVNLNVIDTIKYE